MDFTPLCFAVAAQMAVAASDIVFGAGIFAGQPFSCAVQKFTGEPTMPCSAQPEGSQGPGCVGLNNTGAAPCIGCPPGLTVTYDHCKTLSPLVQVDVLLALAEAAAASGRVPPLENVASSRIYLYRGTHDAVYLDGSVNRTAEFFLALAAEPSQVVFEASIPSQHCMPTIDPWLSPASCGVNAPWAPPAMENCGYDGAGVMLQHFYNGSLKVPPQGAGPIVSQLLAFNQTLYLGDAPFGGLATTGYVYVPQACAAQGEPPCRLHVAMHGCGMGSSFANMNTSFALHAGECPAFSGGPMSKGVTHCIFINRLRPMGGCERVCGPLPSGGVLSRAQPSGAVGTDQRWVL